MLEPRLVSFSEDQIGGLMSFLGDVAEPGVLPDGLRDEAQALLGFLREVRLKALLLHTTLKQTGLRAPSGGPRRETA